VIPLTMFQDDVYVSGELCQHWWETFSRPSVFEMFAFVTNDIDDERAEFIRSLAWRGPHPPF
jgi:predicted solute-binding protein